MSLNDLLKRGWIKPFTTSPDQIQSRLTLARRDMLTAKKLLGSDSDWAFSIAYNAVLQAGRALMFAHGYRPASGEGQHVAVVRFCEDVLGNAMGDELMLFEKMRSKRHRVIYDVAGAVSLEESKAAFHFAETFVKIVTQQVSKKSPRQ